MKEKPIEQVIRTNEEILDKLCQEMRLIAAYGNLSPALKKRMYSTQYWAKHFLSLNNALIKDNWGK